MAQIQQPTKAQNAQSAMAANLAARQSVLQQGYPMLQSIYSANINPASQTILNIPPQNVGLIKGFLVEIVASYTTAATTALAQTPFGPANLLQNVTFQDLQNYQRINTYGWHIAFLNSARQGRPFFSSTASSDPVGYGANWAVADVGSGTGSGAGTWPSAPAASTSYTSRFFYWIPLTYSHSDLTGGIYAGVVNATMNLQLTLATSAQFAVATGDPALAVYSGNTATVTNYAVTVYQSYIDQLPVGQNGAPALPFIDLNTIYELKQTPFQSIAGSADNYFGYSNFRHFMSTTLFYDNGSSWPTIVPGSDINYFSFRTANFTDTRKADPYVWAAFNRQKILTDMPRQVYYFDHRDKPIYTTQTGNTNLVMNPSTVNTNATVTIGWEMLANVTNLINAGSLAANG